jgi:hypothetical protein
LNANKDFRKRQVSRGEHCFLFCLFLFSFFHRPERQRRAGWCCFMRL